MNNELQVRLMKANEQVINEWSYTSITPVTDTSVIALKAASETKINVLKSIQIYNSHATVGTVVTVKDGTTVIWTGYVPAVSGKCEIIFSIPLRGTINTALNFVCSTTGSNVYVSAQGYQK